MLLKLAQLSHFFGKCFEIETGLISVGGEYFFLAYNLMKSMR
jgi:hypothetical protein